MKRKAKSTPSAALRREVRRLGLGRIRRHVFLCRGPECCSMRSGDSIWNLLKDRLREFGLSGPSGLVFRTKADCLRLCREGPILLVYPEGTWYHRVDRAKLERIVHSHLLKGRPLWNEAFASNPLPLQEPRRTPDRRAPNIPPETSSTGSRKPKRRRSVVTPSRR